MPPKPVHLVKVRNEGREFYKNLEIRATAALHEQVDALAAAAFSDRSPPRRILDVACGNGALAARLKDRWPNAAIDGIDLDLPQFEGLTHHAIDLNDPAALDAFVLPHWGVYDLVVGLETIEHLENPWLYLRVVKLMLSDCGTAIVTTPNIDSMASRAHYFVTGTHLQFGPDEVAGTGHVAPISGFEFRTICAAVGLEVVQNVPGGTYPLVYLQRNPLRAALFTAANLLGLFCEGLRYGRNAVYVLRRARQLPRNRGN